VQVKLFNEWWETWSEADREKMNELFKEADPKFWETVESELSGTRTTLNEDFMIVIASTESEDERLNEMNTGGAGNGDSPLPPPVFKVKQIVAGGISTTSNGNGLSSDQDEDEGITRVEEEDPGASDDPDDGSIPTDNQETESNGNTKDGGTCRESPQSPIVTEI
jgi:hypothetical protein